MFAKYLFFILLVLSIILMSCQPTTEVSNEISTSTIDFQETKTVGIMAQLTKDSQATTDAIQTANVVSTANAKATLEAAETATIAYQGTEQAQQTEAVANTAQAKVAAITAVYLSTVNAAEALLKTASTWEIAQSYSFSEPPPLWEKYENINNSFNISSSYITDGKYRIESTAKKGFMMWRCIGEQNELYSDFFVTLEAENVDGSDFASHGFVFRVKDKDNLYSFTIDGRQNYKLDIVKDGNWHPLIPINYSSYINADQPDRISILGQGDHFTFFVNDQFLAETINDEFASGRVCLVIDLLKGDTSVIDFDNFEVRVPLLTMDTSPVITTTLTSSVVLPQPGNWQGETEAGFPISFRIKNEDETVLVTNLEIPMMCSSGELTIELGLKVDENLLIDNGIFQYSSNDMDINGEILESEVIEGTFHFHAEGLCEVTTTWIASPILNSNVLSNLSGRISFSSDRDGNNEIYVMNADGTDQKRITNNARSDMEPSWSPDGSRITFCSDHSGNSEIYVVDSNGSNLQRLTSNADMDCGPVWSPNGRLIAFHSYRGASWDIYVINADGSEERKITDHPETDTYPTWSPDGRHIAFHTTRDGDWEIYSMDSDGTNQKRLTNNPAFDWLPSWSPDGNSLAFWSKRNGEWEVYLINIDAPNPKRLTQGTNLKSGVSRPTWAPDSQSIAVSAVYDGSNYEIFVIDLNGTLLGRLTNTDSENYDPSWWGN
ncbi:DUF5050 domain-containing protein [Chloroflexota bacterium]